MKVIIAGGREFEDMPALEYALVASGFRWEIEQVVSGACGITEREYEADHPVGSKEFRFAKGADGLGERWAYARGIKFVRVIAEWSKYGKPAGPRRNAKMAEYADSLIALPGNTGTANMITQAKKRGLKVFELSEWPLT